MPVTSLYPVLMSDDVARATAFYRDSIGFEVVFESDWYVSMRMGDFELAIIARDHGTIPDGYRMTSRGVIVNLEVDDVDDVHERLTEKLGLTPIAAIRDEDFGQRHFILAAPDGVLLDIIQPIPPRGEYAEA